MLRLYCLWNFLPSTPYISPMVLQGSALVQADFFKNSAKSCVMWVPLAMRFQSLWMMLPVLVSVHLLRLIWSFTLFPRREKSSTVISGTKPFDCKRREENSFGTVFFSSKQMWRILFSSSNFTISKYSMRSSGKNNLTSSASFKIPQNY